MRISSLLLAVFGFASICLLGYMTYNSRYNTLLLFLSFFCIFGLVAVYMLSPQIDWWWYKKNPPPMHRGLEKQMRFLIPFYRDLDPLEQRRFRDRVMMTMEGKEYIPIVFENLPEDIKCIIASHIVMMTFGIEKYLLFPYERVVVYPHAFPTPNHKVLHSSETNHEDGCMIFDAERMMMGVANPVKYYNLILHEYASAFLRNHPDIEFPEIRMEHLPILKEIRGLDINFIKVYVGLNDINVHQAVIEHFFVTPKRFKHFLPVIFEQLTKIFNLDPTLGPRPILNIRKIGENPLIGQ